MKGEKPAKNPERWELLAKKLGFNKKNRHLFLQALTHPAYYEGAKQPGDEDNQRLEFLGDAVLDLLVGYYLFLYYPKAQEGELTKMRSATVCEAFLGKMAENLEINKALRLGKGSEAGGDRSRPSVLADAFEAVLGAIFVTQGFEGASAFVEKHFGAVLENLSRDDYEDKKSLLQEIIQKQENGNVSYKLIEASGPDHARNFISGAYYKKILLGKGEGNSKKESEQAAAKDALNKKDIWLPALKISPGNAKRVTKGKALVKPGAKTLRPKKKLNPPLGVLPKEKNYKVKAQAKAKPKRKSPKRLNPEGKE